MGAEQRPARHVTTMLSRLRPRWGRRGEDADADEDRLDDNEDAKEPKKPYMLQRPANTALRQQRLKAWHPLLTHATVLPLLVGISVLFAIIGAVAYWSVEQVNELTIDYTDCRKLPPNQAPVDIPADKVWYHFHNLNTSAYAPPQWSVTPIPVPEGNPEAYRCTVSFSVPNELTGGVFLYYRLTNFYQNHRRYLKSVDYEQLLSKPRTAKQLHDGQCKPVGRDPATGKGIYPCGLIANSMFNDTFSDPVLLDAASQPVRNYTMSEKGIVWSGEYKRYEPPTYNASDIVPPPFWQGATGPYGYPNGYQEGQVFNPREDEHFQVWMRTASFPTFRKLYKRNDDEPMAVGRYRVTIDDNYPVAMYDGTKAMIISTTTWVGGRNLELGLLHISVAVLCFALALFLAAKQLIKPRRPGDLNLLSWNNPSKPATRT